MSERVFIVAAKRTAIGSFGGGLSNLSATELGAKVVSHILNDVGLKGDELDEIMMGNVYQANLGQAPARQVAKKGGVADNVPATTVNKVCASGMKAISLGAQAIRLGDANLILAGGMECMSQVPFYATSNRWGAKYGDQKLVDGLRIDGLADAYSQEAMGVYADLCAEEYGISREDQDEYAISSYKRSQDAWANNKFKKEVVPITIQTRKGELIMDRDEEVEMVSFEKIPTLRPAFLDDGTVTAANSSTLSDGAAVLLLVGESKMKELSLKPLAEIIAYADAEQSPERFPTTPSLATEKVLKKAGLNIEEIDFFEFNEAFSVVALANAHKLKINHSKLNVYGGAVSMGHPLGCSGARILVTLMSVLAQEGGTYGLASICNGGGGASAMILKNINSSSND